MLTVQHRYNGDIPSGSPNPFTTAKLSKHKDFLLTIRTFVRHRLGVPRYTNRYTANIWAEKEQGGTSSINLLEVQNIMDDI
jgi:hypothetical protein